MKFGEQLKSAREKLNLSIQDVASRTKVRADYLEALETGDLVRLPERPFARSFLQRYARELNLDPAPLLSDFDRLVPMSAPVAASMRGARPVRRGPSLPTGLITGVLSGLVVLGALAWGGYAYYRSSHGTASKAAPEATRVPLASSRQVKLSVASSPTGARVYLDNVYLGLTPIQSFPVDARDGAELRLERSGFAPLKQHIGLNADKHLSAQLSKAAPRPVTATSSAGTSVSAASTGGSSVAGTSSAPGSGVTLHFVGKSWVRVLDRSGKQLFVGIPQPGSQQTYPSGVSVRVGSAGEVQVSVGRGPAQAFGPAGQPLTRSF